MLNKLAELGDFLDSQSFFEEADIVDGLLSIAKDKKWMQKAVNPKEKGELRKKLNVPEGETIPMSLLQSKKKELQEKSKGDKRLTESERELLGQIQFAINARKSKK